MGKFDLGLGTGLLSDVSKNIATNEFKTSYLPVGNIVENELNDGFSMDDIEELKTSIKDVGLQQPLVVMRDGDNFKILSGHRRYRACCELVAEGDEKYKLIPCIIRELDKIDSPLDNETKEIYIHATTNAEIRICTASDRIKIMGELSLVYDKLKASGNVNGKRRDFIADKLGVSPSTVQSLSFIDKNISDDFKSDFEKNKIPLIVAEKIAHLTPKDQNNLYESTDDIASLSSENVEIFKEKQELKAKKKCITDDINYDTYIIGSSDFTSLFDNVSDFRYKFLHNKNVILDKNTYAKILSAKNSIEKTLIDIENIIANATPKTER